MKLFSREKRFQMKDGIAAFIVPFWNDGSRERAGGIEEFNRLRCRVIMQGLELAMNDAKRRGCLDEEKRDDYKILFLLNVAATIRKEGTINFYCSLKLLDQKK